MSQIEEMSARSAPTTAPEQIGATVSDARRLTAKATTVFVRYLCGPGDWQTGYVQLTRSTFLKSISAKNPNEPMPCRLYQPWPDDRQLWLSVGK
jgi:hypothetical protein